MRNEREAIERSLYTVNLSVYQESEKAGIATRRSHKIDITREFAMVNQFLKNEGKIFNETQSIGS